MKFYNYFNVIFSILVLNFAFAELKTFGMPEDTPSEESPAEEVTPEESAPEEDTPEEDSPEDGAPEDGAPEDGAPEDDAPEDGAPEDDDMPIASEDSEMSDDQPVKFKEEYVLSASLSMPIFTGSNLDYRFDKGIGFNLGMTTPFSFNLMDKDINLSLSLKMNSFPVNSAAKSKGTSDYTPMLLGLNMNTNVSVIDLSFGSGLSLASGQVKTDEDYSMTTLYLDLGLGYTLQFEKFSFIPEPLKGMNMSFNSNLIMIMGAPDETGDTSNMVNLGMSLGYPFFF